MAIATNATAMINSKAIVNVSLRMVLLLLRNLWLLIPTVSS
jgi:hypothetical protein